MRKQIKNETIQIVRGNPKKYFGREALEVYSPKFLEILKRIQESKGNQFLYSQFTSAEGLGFFGEVLRQQGFQQYKIRREGGQWVEDMDDPSSTAELFVMYTGAEEPEQRQIYLSLFNNEWASEKIPTRLLEALRKRYGPDSNNLHGSVIKVLMASRAGAEGITLRNVRNVHIMEPYWGPALMDQVIGRAIRICSHAELSPEERTVTVNLYMSVFGDDDINSNDNNAALLRKNDQLLKRYVAEFQDTPLGAPPLEPGTSDEALYEFAFEKRTLATQFSDLLHRSAVDCEVHKAAHSRNGAQPNCMSFISTDPEQVAFHSDIANDPLDGELEMNALFSESRFQKVRIGSNVFLFKPATKEIFHWKVFEQSKRLLRMGHIGTDTIYFSK